MAMKKYGLLIAALISVSAALGAQQRADYSAEGAGRGAAQADAVEAAKIDAVNKLILQVVKYDTVFRDLFLTEAFKSDWFGEPVVTILGKADFSAVVTLAVDEGIIDSLYLGRYSTTVGSLLDAAETALAEVQGFQAEGSRTESNGDLGGAESAYRRAEAKAGEIQRYLDPIRDASYFSAEGKRKAPELQQLVASVKQTAADGIARIRESQRQLEVNAQAQAVLDLLETVETELYDRDDDLDAVHPIASSPRSYETDQLIAARNRIDAGLDALKRRGALVRDKVKTLTPDLAYPRTRSTLILDKIASLERALSSARSQVSGEIFRRSAFMRTVSWTFLHDPLDAVAVGLFFPVGVAPTGDGTESFELPLQFDARAEAAFGVGGGGFWARTRLNYGSEFAFTQINETLTQSLDLGFFGGAVFGLGLRWDWQRRDGADRSVDPVTALSLNLGASGSDLGDGRLTPLWLVSLSYELPRGGGFVLARDVNVALETILRPSRWIRLDAGIATRARGDADGSWEWIGSLSAGVGVRLPFFMPLLLRARWDGASIAPIADGSVMDEAGRGPSAFRFGIEYTF
jgi:hypothetical protein